MRGHLFRIFGLILWAACLCGPSPATAADAAAYKLGAGDKIRLTVYDEKDLSGEFDVNDQGFVALPLIGQVRVAGSTLSEVENVITKAYGKDYLLNPRVSVQVLNYRPFFILGEVRTPGSYPYVNGMTILKAVTLAGGYTPRANQHDMLVKHADQPDGAEEPAHDDTLVLPGDVIRVRERFF